MFVLGIDPGLTRCGFGMLRRADAGARATFSAEGAGVIETDPGDPVDRRLATLSIDLDELLDELVPEVVVVEKIFFQTNVRTAISVAQASGVALAAAARRKIPVVQYTPNEVKLAVVGNGAATKTQVQSMVARLCGLASPPKPPDAADALALAACHLSSARLRAAVAAASAR